MAKEHRIAVIPGDGIGREVMPEGVRVMEAAGAKHGISFQWKEFDWSCDWYKAHGKMCPDDAPQILRRFDAIYFGAVGNPAIVADQLIAAADVARALAERDRRIEELESELRAQRIARQKPSSPPDLSFR